MHRTQTRAVLYVAALTLFLSIRLAAQERVLKNNVTLSAAFLNSDSGDHYIGGSISYFRYISKVVAIKADAADFPEYMLRAGPYGGGRTTSATASGLIGWHGKRFSVMGEMGAGTLAPIVALGTGSNGIVSYGVRRFPTIVLGGVIEKPLSRRWALTYEVKDDWTFMDAITESIIGLTFQFPARRAHELEGRGGLTLRF